MLHLHVSGTHVVSAYARPFEEVLHHCIRQLYAFGDRFGIDYAVSSSAVLPLPSFKGRRAVDAVVSRPFFRVACIDDVSRQRVYDAIDDFVVDGFRDELKMDVAQRFPHPPYKRSVVPQSEALEFLLNEYSPALYFPKSL